MKKVIGIILMVIGIPASLLWLYGGIINFDNSGINVPNIIAAILVLIIPVGITIIGYKLTKK